MTSRRITNKMVFIAVLAPVFGGCGIWPTPEPEPDGGQKPLGLVQLIEFHDIQGLRNWAYELDQRGLKSLVFLQRNMLEAYPADIKWLADQGHEIGGGYA